MTMELWMDYSTFVEEGWKSFDTLQRDFWQNFSNLDGCMGDLQELANPWQPWLSGSTDLWQAIGAASSQFQQASQACLSLWGIVPEDTSQEELAQLAERLQQQKEQITSQKRQIATQKRTITTQKSKLADQKQQILALKKSLAEQKKGMAEQHKALLDLQKQQKALQASAAPAAQAPRKSARPSK